MEPTADIYDFVRESSARLKLAAPNPLVQSKLDTIASSLDHLLDQLVVRLEEVASCQQSKQGLLDEDSRTMAPFCAGMEEVGRQLIDRIKVQFDAEVASSGLEIDLCNWIIETRRDALILYILQLAHVHGLAFADPIAEKAVEEGQLLRILEERLRA